MSAELPLPPDPAEGEEERARLLEAIRRRLLAGEFDSEAARAETAYALLDGDRPRLTRR